MHVMLDLETWGTAPGSAIRSIGAVAFDLTSGEVSEPAFYHNIDDGSCEFFGLTRDAATETFWAKQPREAQEALLKDQLPLAEVLSEFYSWFNAVEGKQVWAQGASFDPVLMDAAFKATGVKPPWKFWHFRDTRTVYDIAGFDYHAEKREGTHHNALDDCLHQIKMVRAAHKLIVGRGE